MDPSEKFLRFAAECELMAKSARNRENKSVWTGLAERWIRFAHLYDSKNAMLHASGSARRHRTPVHGSAH